MEVCHTKGSATSNTQQNNNIPNPTQQQSQKKTNYKPAAAQARPEPRSTPKKVEGETKNIKKGKTKHKRGTAL